MSIRLTFGKVKTQCARVLGLTASDTRVADYVSRAQERLLVEGKWVGTYGRYHVCVTDSCLTWPREIETIEAWALGSAPGGIRSGWYEFLGSGPGVLDEDSNNGRELIDRGDAASFDDPGGGDTKQLAIYPVVAESSGLTVNLQFYDNTGTWVRSQSDGAWIDGERLAINTSAGVYTYSTNSVAKGGFVRAIKPKTNGRILLFEYDTDDGTLKRLADWAPDEELPTYRRSLIPGLKNLASSGGEDCDSQSVTIVGKFRHIPVSNDNDFLAISLTDALILECQAIKKEENNLWEDAQRYHLRAVDLLDKQLAHWNGSGTDQPIKMPSTEVWGGGIINEQ